MAFVFSHVPSFSVFLSFVSSLFSSFWYSFLKQQTNIYIDKYDCRSINAQLIRQTRTTAKTQKTGTIRQQKQQNKPVKATSFSFCFAFAFWLGCTFTAPVFSFCFAFGFCNQFLYPACKLSQLINNLHLGFTCKILQKIEYYKSIAAPTSP